MLRTARGLAPEQLADKAGVHRNTIYNLEAGAFGARAATLHAIVAALGASDAAVESDQGMVEQLAAWLDVRPGELRPAPPADPAIRELVQLLEQVPPDRRAAVVQMLRGLVGLTAK